MKQTPYKARMYFLLAAFFMLLPTVVKLYTGETQRMIVASGKLTDPNFVETVVYVFSHKLTGAAGVVINRDLPADSLDKLPQYLADKNLPLYWGGPVQFPDYVTVLEKSSGPDGAFLISKPMTRAIHDDPDFLKTVEKSVAAGEDKYRIYLGYAGWGAWQLDREFRTGHWASTKINHDLIYNKTMSAKDVWVRALTDANQKRKPRNPGAI